MVYKKSPAFQFYVNDWLSSPKITLMRPEQEGAYIRLLCYCWADEDCSIPNDDEQLIELSRLYKVSHDLAITKSLLIPIKECFSPHPDKPGFLTNQRLIEERIKQQKWREKCKKGGKNGASSRWNKKKKMGVVKVNDDSSSSSSSSSSDIYKKNKKGGSKKTKKSSLEDVTLESISDWLNQKRALGRYLDIDEEELLEKFKDYVTSTGKTYKDYMAAFRNSFKWRDAPRKGSNKGNGKNEKQDIKDQTNELLDDIRSGKYS